MQDEYNDRFIIIDNYKFIRLLNCIGVNVFYIQMNIIMHIGMNDICEKYFIFTSQEYMIHSPLRKKNDKRSGLKTFDLERW